MASFQLLEPREEDELHKLRLLNVEEKPFKRISRRLLAPSSLLTTPLKLPTPPPDTFSNDSENHDLNQEKVNDERRQFKEDILFDFGAFNNSLIRIQFLQDSNKRERQRYKADKERILETAQQVRENTVQLRIQLEEAKQTLEQRKKFDELAEKITGNRLLRPREDQLANLRKLEDECRDLERECQSYKITWGERREQFGRIVEEGMQLRRLIRDEKEEVERREGMAEDEGGDAASGDGQTPRHNGSNGTPKHHSGKIDSTDTNSGFKSKLGISESLSRPASRSDSYVPSFLGSEKREDEAKIEDSIMIDASGVVSHEIESETEVEVTSKGVEGAEKMNIV
ncbi:Bgt-2405 [Blumeria graminis f. sp. tritici]|uniref:Bgt-2405 n=2 Tax=Blumeria graminis f. sp. tritici TaxID=62690 RepID=A0A061HFJ5_BLUGR|nr:Tho complex subunit 7 [Blumeria graminis f. sp. tritici 96224]VDB90986.1 Bgt-2405 [Blumeria graminis f. sp. tritici]